MRALVLALHESEKNSKQVSDSLTLSGHGVVLAKNYWNAIEILKNQQVDLIVSDVHLENGGSVFDFLRWTREYPHTKNIPFVMLSIAPGKVAKHVEDGIRTSARALGAAMFISMETFDREEFRKKIDSLLPAGDQITLASNKDR